MPRSVPQTTCPRRAVPKRGSEKLRPTLWAYCRQLANYFWAGWHDFDKGKMSRNTARGVAAVQLAAWAADGEM
jgi:hypothetical protein